MKTKAELNELKSEVEALSNKLAELSDDELAEVTGGEKRPSFLPFISFAGIYCTYERFDTFKNHDCTATDAGKLNQCKNCPGNPNT